jgi:hypothetical protein
MKMPLLLQRPSFRKWRRQCSWLILFLLVVFVLAEDGASLRAKTHPQEKEHQHHSSSKLSKQSSQEQEFLGWCHRVLGIETSLYIETFEYYDYMRAMAEAADLFTEENDDDIFFWSEDSKEPQTKRLSVADYPRLQVRGLAASKDIAIGEVVIRIPYQALWTIGNAIDRDPVLSHVIGLEARKTFGFEDELYYYELPLLAVALLHHLKLGAHSMLAPYWNLLEGTPLDFPFLWKTHRLRVDANEGTRRVARGIQRDVKELYTAVVQVLIEKHPDLFAAPPSSEDDADKYEDEDEWMFSFEKFEWAFALVNSRHWNLPIPQGGDTPNEFGDHLRVPSTPSSSTTPVQTGNNSTYPPLQQNETSDDEETQGSVGGAPPASMPTDEWVHLQEQERRKEKEEKGNGNGEHSDQKDKNNNIKDDNTRVNQIGHSFLAPVADLLNFGPPCTHGVYNAKTQSFEIIASCSFQKGQEVTFWYSESCDSIVLANYGFTHPMVPKCPTLADWKRMAEAHARHSVELEHELFDLFDDLDGIDRELERVQGILEDCDCCDDPKKTEGTKQQEQQQQQQRRQVPTESPRKKPPPSPHSRTLITGDEHNGIRGGAHGDPLGRGQARERFPNRRSAL